MRETSSASPDMHQVRADAERLWTSHMEMAEIGALPNGGSCRLTLTDEDREARDLLWRWCEDAGMSVVVDEVGNMFATRAGRSDDPPVATGSHLDTQPHGGRFDGVFGVLAGLEVVRALNDAGIQTRKPIALVNWTNEEGVRFPSGVLGSSVWAGLRSVEDARALPARDGPAFAAELERIGYDGQLAAGAFAMDSFFEGHIEQGPILEREETPIGIVTRVQGLRWFEVTVDGADRHAGTTPMDIRKDSLVGAARMVLGLSDLGRAHAPDARVTVGRLTVEPNAGSTIPGRTVFGIDLRHPENHVLDHLEREIADLCREAARQHDVSADVARFMTLDPLDFDSGCVQQLEEAASRLGYRNRRMISGAIHDASPVGQIVPAAMIFVPCRDGISHSEDEWSEPEHLEAGANVLLQAILARAGVA